MTPGLVPAGRLRGDRVSVRRVARRLGVAPGRVSGRGAGERHGRRDRPMAPLPRRRRLAVVVLACGPVGLGDADPRPPRLGARRPAGLGTRRSTRSATGCWNSRAAVARAGRLLRPDSAARRHPPRADHVFRDISLHPPADERHRLRLAACVGHGVGAGKAVPLPVTSTWLATTDHWVSWLIGLRGLAVRPLVGSRKSRHCEGGDG
jgi:hypothetical protein